VSLTDNVFRADPIDNLTPIVKDGGAPADFFVQQWNALTDFVFTSASNTGALGDVEIEAGTGLNGGGPLSAGTVTISLQDTAVTPGTFGDASNVAQITVDQQGRITAVANVAVSGGGGGGGPSTTDFPNQATFGSPGTIAFADLTRGGGVLLSQTTPGANNATVIQTRAAAEPSSGTTEWIFHLRPQNDLSGSNPVLTGVVLAEDSGNRLLIFGFFEAAAQVYVQARNGTSFVADLRGGKEVYASDYWLRITVDSSGNVGFYTSTNGDFWLEFTTTTLSAYLEAGGGTFDKIGLVALGRTGTAGTAVACYLFEENTT